LKDLDALSHGPAVIGALTAELALIRFHVATIVRTVTRELRQPASLHAAGVANTLIDKYFPAGARDIARIPRFTPAVLEPPSLDVSGISCTLWRGNRKLPSLQVPAVTDPRVAECLSTAGNIAGVTCCLPVILPSTSLDVSRISCALRCGNRKLPPFQIPLVSCA